MLWVLDSKVLVWFPLEVYPFPIGGVHLFLFYLSRWMLRTRWYQSIVQDDISQYWLIRENNRQDLVINYRKTLDTDFSILQKTRINFPHLHNIRELWDREVIISPEKTHTRTSKENSPSCRTNTNWRCRKICFLKSQKYSKCCLSLWPLWNNEGAVHRQTDVYKKN